MEGQEVTPVPSAHSQPPATPLEVAWLVLPALVAIASYCLRALVDMHVEARRKNQEYLQQQNQVLLQSLIDEHRQSDESETQV